MKTPARSYFHRTFLAPEKRKLVLSVSILVSLTLLSGALGGATMGCC